MSRRKFSKEFKVAAIRRLQGGQTAAEVARALEVHPAELYRWRREVDEHGERAFQGVGRQRAAESRVGELERKIGQQTLEIDFLKRTPEQAGRLTAQYRSVAVELAPVRQKMAELRAQIEALQIPRALIMAEDTSVARPTTNIRMRGAFISKGELVEADVPSFLGPPPAGAPPNRLGLANGSSTAITR